MNYKKNNSLREAVLKNKPVEKKNISKPFDETLYSHITSNIVGIFWEL